MDHEAACLDVFRPAAFGFGQDTITFAIGFEAQFSGGTPTVVDQYCDVGYDAVGTTLAALVRGKKR